MVRAVKKKNRVQKKTGSRKVLPIEEASLRKEDSSIKETWRMRNGAEDVGRNMLNQGKNVGGLKISWHELQALRNILNR